MKKILLYMLLALTCYAVKSQETKLLGNWEGELTNQDEEIIWKVRIKILSETSAELHLYDNDKGAYFNYLTDKRFSDTKRTVTFKAKGNYGVMTVNYSSSTSNGQSVYNLQYNEKEDDVFAIWSNLNNPLSGNLFGSAVLISDKVKIFYEPDITIGGKSFNYLGIDKIELGEKMTKVSITVKNTTENIFNGTYHEPGHSTAFYLTDANRTTKFKLTGANVTLPYSLNIEPGKTKIIILYFEPLPLDTKLINIFENGPSESTNLWKFYDVFLKK